MATTLTTTPGEFDLSGSPRRHRRERAIAWFFRAAALSSVVISAAIVISLVGEAISFLRTVELGSLWSEGWFPRRNLFDIKTLFVGSLIVTGVAMVIATPLGLGAAIYLSEYARPRARKILKPILEILAGIPSIVIVVLRDQLDQSRIRTRRLERRRQLVQPDGRGTRCRNPRDAARRVGE